MEVVGAVLKLTPHIFTDRRHIDADIMAQVNRIVCSRYEMSWSFTHPVSILTSMINSHIRAFYNFHYY